jgi:hypothetical protein
MKNSFADTWADIGQEVARSPKPHFLLRRVIPEGSLDAFIGIEFPEDRRLFALEAALPAFDKLGDLPAFKGLGVSKRDSVSGNKDKAALLITLKAVRFADVFSVLIEDVTTELQAVSDENEALTIIISRLIEWQQLIESGSQEGLSEEAARGLYGELYFLATRLLPSMGARSAFGWKGFGARQQDYYFGNDAIEIKTSKAKQHQKLAIASERQLDESTLERLFLYHLSVAELPDNGNTLPALIERIRNVIHKDVGVLAYFEDALFQIGYLDAHRKLYDAVGYEIREENLFAVTGRFPRILEKDLLSGVGDVTYSINVAECRHYAVELSVLETLKQESGNG